MVPQQRQHYPDGADFAVGVPNETKNISFYRKNRGACWVLLIGGDTDGRGSPENDPRRERSSLLCCIVLSLDEQLHNKLQKKT